MTWWTVGWVGAALVFVAGAAVPVTHPKHRYGVWAYGVLVAAAIAGLCVYQQQSSREGRLAFEVQNVLDVRKVSSTETFIQAALTFLDKNKDLFPDAYLRGREVCVQHQCHTDGSANADEAQAIAYDLTQAGAEMDAILRKLSGLPLATP